MLEVTLKESSILRHCIEKLNEGKIELEAEIDHLKGVNNTNELLLEINILKKALRYI